MILAGSNIKTVTAIGSTTTKNVIATDSAPL